MPNETLIQQLETLREIYTQQQKVAATLQTTFKAVTDAQNKTRKALNEYSVQNSGADISTAQNTFQALRLKEDTIDPLLPGLRREIKTLTSLSGALKDAGVALRSEPVDVVKLDGSGDTLTDARAVVLLKKQTQHTLMHIVPLRKAQRLARKTP